MITTNLLVQVAGNLAKPLPDSSVSYQLSPESIDAGVLKTGVYYLPNCKVDNLGKLLYDQVIAVTLGCEGITKKTKFDPWVLINNSKISPAQFCKELAINT